MYELVTVWLVSLIVIITALKLPLNHEIRSSSIITTVMHFSLSSYFHYSTFPVSYCSNSFSNVSLRDVSFIPVLEAF